jgi:nucleoside-diphosphate-sugar epimerase
MTQTRPENVLVTGGGGFLGKAIVKRLIDKGCRVTSFSRNRYPALDCLNVHQIKGDISNSAAVTKACQGMDLVFHVAAMPGVWGKYVDYYATNVIGTKNIIAACRQNHIPRLIYTSSPSVVFNGKDMEGVDESAPYALCFHTHYPKTKAIAEKAIIAACAKGLSAIILRPHLIWGPGDNHLAPRIIHRAKRLRIVGNGKNKVDTIYIDNAALAHVLAAEKLAGHPELSGNVYFISQDEPLPLWEMVNYILAAGGKKPVTRKVPFRVAWAAGALLEFFYKIFKLKGEPMMTRFVTRELSTAHWFDISAAKKDFGYVPEVSTAQGLERLKKWLHS